MHSPCVVVVGVVVEVVVDGIELKEAIKPYPLALESVLRFTVIVLVLE